MNNCQVQQLYFKFLDNIVSCTAPTLTSLSTVLKIRKKSRLSLWQMLDNLGHFVVWGNRATANFEYCNIVLGF